MSLSRLSLWRDNKLRKQCLQENFIETPRIQIDLPVFRTHGSKILMLVVTMSMIHSCGNLTTVLYQEVSCLVDWVNSSR